MYDKHEGNLTSHSGDLDFEMVNGANLSSLGFKHTSFTPVFLVCRCNINTSTFKEAETELKSIA
jgi:hypothetical protein